MILWSVTSMQRMGRSLREQLPQPHDRATRGSHIKHLTATALHHEVWHRADSQKAAHCRTRMILWSATSMQRMGRSLREGSSSGRSSSTSSEMDASRLTHTVCSLSSSALAPCHLTCHEQTCCQDSATTGSLSWPLGSLPSSVLPCQLCPGPVPPHLPQTHVLLG